MNSSFRSSVSLHNSGFCQIIKPDALGALESRFRPPVNECASPKFQYEEDPKSPRVVPHAAPVFIKNFEDRPVIEIAAFARATAVQCVVKHLAQFVVEPSADRHVEALFGPVDDLVGDQSRGGSFENVFGLQPAQLK